MSDEIVYLLTYLLFASTYLPRYLHCTYLLRIFNETTAINVNINNHLFTYVNQVIT